MSETTPPTAVDIRPAVAEDIPAMAAVLGELFEQEPGYQPDAAVQRRALKEILDHPDLGATLVAADRGEVVGIANLLWHPSTAMGARVATLEDLVVTATRRGEGIGKALVAEAIRVAKAQGCPRLRLHTNEQNTSAQRLYAGYGFSRLHVWTMQLSFPPA